jgi:hypothetical protein
LLISLISSLPASTLSIVIYIFYSCRYIQSTCATSGEGLYEGLDWLSNNIANKVNKEKNIFTNSAQFKLLVDTDFSCRLTIFLICVAGLVIVSNGLHEVQLRLEIMISNV